MKRLRSNVVGIEQGASLLFSDYEDNGAMWTGTGPREARQPVQFSETFRAPPAVTVGIGMWDMDHKANLRADISAEHVTAKGFEIVFRTWGDSRVARVRAEWMAIGALRDEDDWEID
ncbi:H-type lectin domain-containing protein [Acidimangrovimonas sediminis]|uniref:H-type lectin domain-containing protein n=1 Tax=Acidimangrovimonas sediminis TaxID=2056283 RepID=UPI000C810402|nr:H-type lectin domain-containing protein [Acidimangrovimonas sediminis]